MAWTWPWLRKKREDADRRRAEVDELVTRYTKAAQEARASTHMLRHVRQENHFAELFDNFRKAI